VVYGKVFETWVCISRSEGWGPQLKIARTVWEPVRPGAMIIVAVGEAMERRIGAV
jgi:hypothetical protein